MASNYNWKDKYYLYSGEEAGKGLSTGHVAYVSLLGKNTNFNTATKDNPCNSSINFAPVGTHSNNNVYILSAGVHTVSALFGAHREIIGQGQTTEIALLNLAQATTYISDCKISGNIDYQQTYLKRCEISGSILTSILKCYNCLVTKDQTYFALYDRDGANNSFVNLLNASISLYKSRFSLYSNSNVMITQADLAYKDYYLGFDNCRFKIGDESDYLELIGNTEAELRKNFVDRCVAQKLTVPVGTEYGETNLSVYRWVFAKDSTINGSIIRNSIVDKFQKRRSILLGWKEETVEPIAVTTDDSKTNSIGKVHSANVDASDNAIFFEQTVDITKQEEGTATSNIIWLGEGMQKINSVNIMHSLAAQYGVMMDSTPSIQPVANGQIEEGEYYLVRSTNKTKAHLTYNEVSYNSSLSERKNIFVGISGKGSWIDSSGNEQVYKVKDLAIQHTIQMRVVNSLPSDILTEGGLESGYWYFVEPNDINNPSGSVTYNGKQYPCFGSFLSTGGTFTVSGHCHLRRCWKQDYDCATEIIDQDFWRNIQKPQWFDVNPEDMRCLMKNNNPKNGEMFAENGTYIASGYPGFYQMIGGETGVLSPAYPIAGKYMQVQLVLSTLNPM